MRLHRLEVSAFGPYSGHETVDFDTLGADGLFLLHGDTGAGKTSLLDAIAYAIFGAVPGARGEVKRLRCDLSSPDTPTEVRLELTVQGQRLQISRSPEYDRPKKRGDGTTKQPAKGSLVWLDDADRAALTRLDEIGRTMQRLLGMSAEQFFQVVLLPQGEFARFLRAETAEREHLLEQLFGTQRFAEVERWFAELRARERGKLQAEQAKGDELVARIAQVVGIEPPEEGVGEEWLGQLLHERKAAVQASTEEERTAREAAAKASAAAEAARTRAQRVHRVRKATAELAELDAAEPVRAAKATELAQGRKVVPVLAARQQLAEAQRRSEVAHTAVDAARDALPTARRAELSEQPSADLRALAGDYRQRGGELSALVEQAEAQKTDIRAITELTDRLTELAERKTKLDAELASLPAAIEQSRALVEDANRSAALLPSATEQRDAFTERLAAARRLPALRDQLRSAEQEQRSAVDAHQRARERVLDLRASRLDSMAAELAGELKRGKPCSVCGSKEHPKPAPLTLGVVGDDEESAAATAEQETAARRDEAARQVQEHTRAVQAVLERLDGAGEEELAERLAELQQRHAKLTTEAAAAGERTEHLHKEERAQTELHEQLTAVRTESAAGESEQAGARGRVAQRADVLEQARGDFEDVGAHRDHLLALANAIDALAQARAELDVRRAAEQERSAAVDAAVQEAGFGSAEQALAAARTDAEIAALEEHLAEAERARLRARSVLDDEENAGIDPAESGETTEADSALAEAGAALEHAVGALRSAVRQGDETEALATRLREHWRNTEPMRERFAELDALTDVVNGRGQNAKRMSLRAFVLAARLQEVAIAASSRLRTMSQGRYGFVHSEAAGARGTRGGLGLDVLDDYSGQVRPAKTLSGGESFMASLALALGLADVVAAETGGAQLDTLFVDEGFGTLDADSLEDVMSILDELRAGGRIVGLVSHVDELRQRVPTQLRVRKSRGGSTLELRSG
ncbi:AAA family ATPase [Sciscionella marina]|uniref:AAA family ATPase n=1 Tax=Sciscionella marina TaxID=508770 RepID=UPI0003674054|nr:SMC family ATPase [Sciscionella marina]